MSIAPEIPIAPTPANALPALKERIAAGRISWAGPLLLVSARTVLLLLAQALVALILLALHRPEPWRAAGAWWNIDGTLVDIGCLLGMKYFTRKEGISLRDLVGPIKMRWGRDLWLGLGYFLLIFPFFVGAGIAAQYLLYGATPPPLGTWMSHVHGVPLWATIYSLSIWWLIWSPTEEATYQAYAMPRLRALTGRTWLAFIVVAFFWAVQHCFLAFVPDWRFALYRFLAFLPGVMVMMLVYMRTRRLAPLVIAHWPMDIIASLMASGLF
jgi:hypothetical protein